MTTKNKIIYGSLALLVIVLFLSLFNIINLGDHTGEIIGVIVTVFTFYDYYSNEREKEIPILILEETLFSEELNYDASNQKDPFSFIIKNIGEGSAYNINITITPEYSNLKRINNNYEDIHTEGIFTISHPLGDFLNVSTTNFLPGLYPKKIKVTRDTVLKNNTSLVTSQELLPLNQYLINFTAKNFKNLYTNINSNHGFIRVNILIEYMNIRKIEFYTSYDVLITFSGYESIVIDEILEKTRINYKIIKESIESNSLPQ